MGKKLVVIGLTMAAALLLTVPPAWAEPITADLESILAGGEGNGPPLPAEELDSPDQNTVWGPEEEMTLELALAITGGGAYPDGRMIEYAVTETMKATAAAFIEEHNAGFLREEEFGRVSTARKNHRHPIRGTVDDAGETALPSTTVAAAIARQAEVQSQHPSVWELGDVVEIDLVVDVVALLAAGTLVVVASVLMKSAMRSPPTPPRPQRQRRLGEGEILERLARMAAMATARRLDRVMEDVIRGHAIVFKPIVLACPNGECIGVFTEGAEWTWHRPSEYMRTRLELEVAVSHHLCVFEQVEPASAPFAMPASSLVTSVVQ